MVVASFPFSVAVAQRPREFVRVAGKDAVEYLQRMVSNDVAALGVGDSCDALLLTPKARVIAPLRILRRSTDDFLVLTEPSLGEVVRSQLLRTRFAAKVEIEREDHESVLLLAPGARPTADGLTVPNDDYGVPGAELIDGVPPPDAVALDDADLDALRIRARTPLWGREVDDRVLPAEAGLVERAVSFSKGCYPGQEPIARLHYRGHANRGLRVLELEGDEFPAYDAPLRLGDKVVGRVTSAARDRDGRIIALGFVRTDVPDGADMTVDGAVVRISV